MGTNTIHSSEDPNKKKRKKKSVPIRGSGRSISSHNTHIEKHRNNISELHMGHGGFKSFHY